MPRYKATRLPSVSQLRFGIKALVSTFLALGAVVSSSPGFGQPLVFEDGEFLNENWQRTTIAAAELGTDISLLVTRRAVDGNPGAYRRHYFHTEARGGELPLLNFSRNLSASVDPAAIGGISFLNYSEDAQVEPGSFYAQVTGPALVQEGLDGIQRVFIPNQTSYSLRVVDSTWTSKSLAQLTQNDFTWVRGGPSATFFDSTVSPDFSPSGNPIGLGFFRLVFASSDQSFSGGTDNWRVEVLPRASGNMRPIARSDSFHRQPDGQITITATGRDPDDGPNPLNYRWRQILGPLAEFSTSGANLTFTPPRYSYCGNVLVYRFGYVANDGLLDSLEATITINLSLNPLLPPCQPTYGEEDVQKMYEKACILTHIWNVAWHLWMCMVNRDPATCPSTNFIPGVDALQIKDVSAPPGAIFLDIDFLPTYRAARDRILATTVEGQRLVQLYETHSPEVVKILEARPDLFSTLTTPFAALQPVFQALLSGNGVNVTLTESQAASLNSMMDAIASAASPELRDAIAAERTKWGPLENYIGRSATEVQQALFGYGVYLPRITLASTLVLTNATANETRATIDWTDSTGKIVASAEKTISPLGVTVVAAPSADFTGAARVLSDRLVRAFVVNRSADGGVLDTYEGAVPGKRVTVPLFRQPGAAGAALTVYNIDATSPAEVTIGHRDERGTEQGTKTVTIPPLGLHTFDAKTINGKAKGASVAVLSSTRPVVASQQSSSRRSRAALPAVAESKECTSCTLGLVPFGPSKEAGQRADIYVHNRDTAEATVTLTYLDPKGNKRATHQQKIPALGLARFDSSKAVRRGRALTGYVQVTQAGLGQRRLAVQWLVRNEKGGGQIGFNAIGTTSGAPTWACVDSQRGKNARQRPLTRLAILNPTSTADQATVELYDAESGQRLSTQTLQLPAGGLVDLSLTTKEYRQANVGFAVVRSATGAALIINARSGGPGEVSRSSCQPLV